MKIIIRSLVFVSIFSAVLALAFGCKGKPDHQVHIFYDDRESAILFAAEDLKQILEGKNIPVALFTLNDLPSKPKGKQIVIAVNEAFIQASLKAAKGKALPDMGEQDYALRLTGKGARKTYWAIGGDRIGAMYGGIHMGEIVKAFGLDSVKNEDHKPYIAKRGIKFNIPLDERQPSHDDRGTAAQTNIKNMWDLDFWTAYLDVLARQRYNVLSLWNQHPFPSMLKLDDYPDVALEDVYNKQGKVKTMSIEQKIEMWKKVMDYAQNRGIEVFIITWNIHMNGAVGKYGISESKDNEITIDYLRKSVEKIFLTYPKLAGIGVTAGENMHGIDPDAKEEWLWQTYGKGIQDLEKIQPDRDIRFIHRFWWTDFEKIDSRFGQLRNGFDMSFKYAQARGYAVYDPKFAEKELLPNLPEGMSTWWNVRNDDIYNLRWGDPEYVKQFILHFPKGDKTAGFYMGSDRYAWGRESISLNPLLPRELENDKHWYSFLLWGRLAYDPETSTDLLKGLIKDHFPGVDVESLYTAWQESSKVIPLVNKFHWFGWDYLWWPEAGISTGVGAAIAGYHDINDFIDAPVFEDSDFMTIPEYAELVLSDQTTSGTTPLEVAELLESYATKALDLTSNMTARGDNELSETIGDIRAMAYLGSYYAKKIRGATNLKLFRDSKDEKYRAIAISELEQSLVSWQMYAQVLERQYIKMTIAMQGIFDWDRIEIEVKEDILRARNSK